MVNKVKVSLVLDSLTSQEIYSENIAENILHPRNVAHVDIMGYFFPCFTQTIAVNVND